VNVRTLLVGTDGSAVATAAVAFAAELARCTGARLVVASAVGLLDAERSPGGHRSIRAQLDGVWTEPARRLQVAPDTVLRDGHPVQVLLDVADDVDADMIVVGSRGFGGFPQMLLGSTSTQLAQHSRRPVLIVPGAMP
jgi:nucleotide-binding universal stress UspA family protein